MFGLGATLVLSRSWVERENKSSAEDVESSYTSDFLALLGTVLMFVLWPSINSALANPAAQARVVINTVLSLCSSCIFTFWVSRTFKRRRFGIRDIQNATLSGGVVMASSVASTIIPGAAMLVGAICATVVTIGISFWKPWLDRHFVHDSRGAIQLHGVAGFISAVAGIVATSIANNDQIIFGQNFNDIFRRGSGQPGFQTAALFITIGIGILSGFLVSFAAMLVLPRHYVIYFSDEQEWNVPFDFDSSLPVKVDAPAKQVAKIDEN